MTVGRTATHCTAAGFTLIEVLVVSTIIAVLASMAVSATTVMRTRARIVESSANLRSLAIANADYQTENGMFCPADDQSNNRRWHGSRTSTQSKFDPRTGFLSPYLGQSMRVTLCPLFKKFVNTQASFEMGTGGYGYNSAYIGGLPGGKFDKTTKLRVAERLSNIPDPSRTVMFTTTAYVIPSGLQEYAYCEPPFWDFGSGPSGSRPSPTVHFRANGKALVAWCDGSVTAEACTTTGGGDNVSGGNETTAKLGWFGRVAGNGYWNPRLNTPTP